MRGVQLNDYDQSNENATCNGLNQNYTFCLNGLPNNIIPEPRIYTQTGLQPVIFPGVPPSFNLTFLPDVDLTASTLKLRIQNFSAGQQNDVWFNEVTGELLPAQDIILNLDLLANAETRRNVIPLCNPWNNNTVFSSVENLQNEIWEYTSDGGYTWTVINETSNNFFIEDLGGTYKIRSTPIMHTIGNYQNIAVRARIPISEVNQDNEQSCRDQDVVVWRGKFEPYVNNANLASNTFVCLGTDINVNVNNPFTIDIPNLADWQVVGPSGQIVAILQNNLQANNTKLSFTPSQTGTYQVRLKVRDACGVLNWTIFKDIECIQADQVQFTISNSSPCVSGPQTITASGNLCNFEWIDIATSTRIAFGQNNQLNIDPNLYPNGIRLIGYDCLSNCSSEKIITFNISTSNKITFVPPCKDINNYTIYPIFEDGTRYSNLSSQNLYVEVFGGDELGWIPNVTSVINNYQGSSGNSFSLNLLAIAESENSGMQKCRITLFNPALDVCTTVYFTVFRKTNLFGTGEVQFEGLNFIINSTEFRTITEDASTYLNIHIEKNAKIYFMHSEVEFGEDAFTRHLFTYSRYFNSTSKYSWKLGDGVNLEIEEGAELTSECKMWPGILMTNGGPKKDASQLFCKIGKYEGERTKISNAFIALRLLNSSNVPVNPSLFRIESTDFFNNMGGVLYEGNPRYEFNQPDYQSKIRDNSFDSDSKTMLAPFKQNSSARVYIFNEDYSDVLGQEDRNFGFISQFHFMQSGFTRPGDNQVDGIVYFDSEGSSNEPVSEIFYDNVFNNAVEALVVRSSPIVGFGISDPGVVLLQGHNNTFSNCHRFAIGYSAWDHNFSTNSRGILDRISQNSVIDGLEIQLPDIDDNDPVNLTKLYYPNLMGVSLWPSSGISFSPAAISFQNTNLMDKTTLGIFYRQEEMLIKNVSISGNGANIGKTIGIHGTFNSIEPGTPNAEARAMESRVSNSSFMGLTTALNAIGSQVRPTMPNNTISIENCVFQDCETSIDIPSIEGTGAGNPVNFKALIKCNKFLPDPSVQSVGIKIGSAASRLTDINFPNNRGSNVFPLAAGINRTVLPINPISGLRINNVDNPNSGWLSPSNWKSITSNSPNNVRYYKYANEFVGTNLSVNTGSIAVNASALLATNNHILGDSEDDDLIESVCENITTEVNFPTPLIQRNGNEANGHFKNNQTTAVTNLHLFLVQNNEFINSYIIVDILGRVTYTSDQAFANNMSEPNLNTGTYILVLNLKSGETSTKKLIIQ